MRIAFLASHYLNPDDPHSWSGLPFFMRYALEHAGLEVITLMADDVDQSRRWANHLYWRWFHGKRFLVQCDAELLQSHARQYERRLAGLSVDAVFSPSTWPLAFLSTELPAVFWTDACFAGMVDFYDSFSNLAPPSLAAAHAMEQRAFQRATRAIFASEWGVHTARRNYDLSPARVRCVPFGANLRSPPTLAEARAAVEQRAMDACHLLLVAVDWERKGAATVVAIARALRDADVPCHLTIVGCAPPAGEALPAFVEVIPFLDQATPADRVRLHELYRRAHFFVMPSRAEAFGIAYVEANAHGVPAVGAAVGGVPTVIRDGLNGRLFAPTARPEDYAAWLLELWQNPAEYRALALRSAEVAVTHFSWEVVGREVADIIAEAVHSEDRPPLDIPDVATA